MKFYFKFSEVPDHPHTYYTDDEINRIPLYPETPEILKSFEEDDNSDFLPVYSATGWSWEAIEVRDESQARRELGISLNQSVYEYINDL